MKYMLLIYDQESFFDTLPEKQMGELMTAFGSFTEALKKSGGVVMTTRTVVSKKGAVTIITANGADAKGQPTKDVLVWDKQ